jgi:predicted nuclease with TOPRIM domain
MTTPINTNNVDVSFSVPDNQIIIRRANEFGPIDTLSLDPADMVMCVSRMIQEIERKREEQESLSRQFLREMSERMNRVTTDIGHNIELVKSALEDSKHIREDNKHILEDMKIIREDSKHIREIFKDLREENRSLRERNERMEGALDRVEEHNKMMTEGLKEIGENNRKMGEIITVINEGFEERSEQIREIGENTRRMIQSNEEMIAATERIQQGMNEGFRIQNAIIHNLSPFISAPPPRLALTGPERDLSPRITEVEEIHESSLGGASTSRVPLIEETPTTREVHSSSAVERPSEEGNVREAQAPLFMRAVNVISKIKASIFGFFLPS